MAKFKKHCKTCANPNGYKETDSHDFLTVEHPYAKPEGYDNRLKGDK